MSSKALPRRQMRRSNSNVAWHFSLNSTEPGNSGLQQLVRLEVAHIRRLLSSLGRHQVAIGTDHVVFATDEDVAVAFRADIFVPIGARIGIAVIALDNTPWAHERVVGHRDLVDENVLVGLAQ